MLTTKTTFAKLALIFTAIAWASTFVGIRFTLEEYTPGGLALLRYLIGSLVMLPLYCFFKQSISHKWSDILFAMALGFLGFAIYNIFLNYGEQTVTAGVASFIVGLVPVFVVIFAYFFYHERMNYYVKTGLIVSTLGLFCIMLGESILSFGKGVLLIMVAVVAASIYSLLQKRLLIRLNAIEFTAYAIWGGTLMLLMYLPQLLGEVQEASFLATTVVIYMGIFPGAIAYICWSYGFKNLTATQAVSYSYWIPLFSIILAFIFLHEVPTAMSLFGGILALLGAIIVNKYNVQG